MEYTNEVLLAFALRMLDHAAEEQAKSNRKNKWLSDNQTINRIRERVEENKKTAEELSFQRVHNSNEFPDDGEAVVKLDYYSF